MNKTIKTKENEVNKIVERQNEEVSLRRWTAQNRLYKRAKRTGFISFVACVVPVVIMGIAKLWFGGNETFITFYAVCSALATVVKLFLDTHEKGLREKAALLQQVYDTYIFEMEWDERWGQKPTADDVEKVAQGNCDYHALNWYDEQVEKANRSVGVLLCQMENVAYEKNLKTTFYIVCNVLLGLMALILIVGGVLYNMSLGGFLLSVVLPLVPLCLWYRNLIIIKKKEEEYRKVCKELTDKAYEGAKRTQKVSNTKLCRIQTELLNYRKNAKTLPECVYRLLRQKNEHIAYVTMKDRLRELKITQ